MMHEMIHGFSRVMRDRGVPEAIVHAMQTPLGGSLLAKGAIGTELALAGLLWWPRTRKLAMWLGLAFHVTISQITPVRLFTIEMLLVYLLFATPDVGARVVRYDPNRDTFVNVIEGLDWLRRFTFEKKKGAPFVLVDRDGEEKRGPPAAAVIFGALPALFILWPIVAILAAVRPHPTGGPPAPSEKPRASP
jgi:hypothetical protein